MLNILISSTCVDLKEERNNIYTSLKAIGHNVVLSEMDHILYDPREHTHTNCIRAVLDCDIVIFLIGNRFGGTAVQDALDCVELEQLESSNIDFFKDKAHHKISITQCEILTAIKNNIPIYTFIKNEVYANHKFYEDNKGKNFINEIAFSSFRNNTEVKYIFEFYNFVRKQRQSNYCKHFDRSDEIVSVMKGQLSMLLARLIKETKSEILAPNNNMILSATVVGHLSTERQKIFDRLYHNVDKGDTIKILGTGVTNFLGNEERIHGYLKDGNKIEVLMVNNNIIKDDLHCTSDVFINNINYFAKTNTVELIDKDLKVHCYLANTNFLIDKNHFNNYHKRANYNDNVAQSVALIKKYRQDDISEKFKGSLLAKHFCSFTPLSITAILKNDKKKNDLLAEFIIPFTEKRIIIHSTYNENHTVFDLFMDFFDSTWTKAIDII